jgi:hypothetical protein
MGVLMQAFYQQGTEGVPAAGPTQQRFRDFDVFAYEWMGAPTCWWG